MFFILPLAHEFATARRWPYVALALVLLNFLVTFGIEVGGKSDERYAAEQLEHVASYLESRKYLSACPGLPIAQGVPDVIPEGVSDQDLVGERAELEARCDSARTAIAKLPSFRYGDVPARGGALTLFTHQFLHAGWLHLFFNLWFLWLTAANLEDRWGRPVFLAFYLMAGVAGAFAHRFSAPGSFVPLVGASGAIAGAMGGFLIVYTTAKIRFLYVYILMFKPRWGTFDAPAYVMLPLWLASEILSGLLSPSDGTAHWAHVGGFVFGVAAAFVMKLSGLDAKLDASVEVAATTAQDSRILAASALIDSGQANEAVAALSTLATEMPTAIDPRLELLRAATAAGRDDVRAVTMTELVALYADAGEPEAATDLLLELKKHRLAPLVPRGTMVALGERLARRGQPMLAGQAYAIVHADGLGDVHAVQAAIGHATLLIRLGHLADARELLGRAKESPFSTMELDSKMDAQLAAIDRASASAPG